MSDVRHVAVSAIDALKNQPMLLALLLFNLLIFAVIFWSIRDGRTHQAEVMKTLLDQNKQAIELLSRCVVPKVMLRD